MAEAAGPTEMCHGVAGAPCASRHHPLLNYGTGGSFTVNAVAVLWAGMVENVGERS